MKSPLPFDLHILRVKTLARRAWQHRDRHQHVDHLTPNRSLGTIPPLLDLLAFGDQTRNGIIARRVGQLGIDTGQLGPQLVGARAHLGVIDHTFGVVVGQLVQPRP